MSSGKLRGIVSSVRAHDVYTNGPPKTITPKPIGLISWIYGKKDKFSLLAVEYGGKMTKRVLVHEQCGGVQTPPLFLQRAKCNAHYRYNAELQENGINAIWSAVFYGSHTASCDSRRSYLVQIL
jgi:hypothetical protein